MLAIRLPKEIEKRLDALARATGRTKTFYAREAILAHLDDLEDTYLGAQRSTSIQAGRVAAVSLGDVIKGLGDQESGLLL
jgi:RHH-type rel operon transcriptional repressor/antitoxin RelB